MTANNRTIKVCLRCKTEKPATREYFYSEPKNKSGLRSQCRTCYAEQNAEYRSTHKESIRQSKRHYAATNVADQERRKRYRAEHQEQLRRLKRRHYDANKQKTIDRATVWRRANPEKKKACNKHWQQQNKEHIREKQRLWRNNNPEKVKAKRQRFFSNRQRQGS